MKAKIVFHDTGKWRREKFTSLSAEAKLALFYIEAHCDHAGVWEPNFSFMNLQMGTCISREEFLSSLDGWCIELSNGMLFFPHFIAEQYPAGLNPANKCHKSVIEILTRNGLEDFIAPAKVEPKRKRGGFHETHPNQTDAPSKALARPLHAPRMGDARGIGGSQEQEQEKDQDQVIGGSGGKLLRLVHPSPAAPPGGPPPPWTSLDDALEQERRAKNSWADIVGGIISRARAREHAAQI